MKNKSKRASALVLLLLPLFCQYATTIEIQGRFNNLNFRSFQNLQLITPTEEVTSNGGLKSSLPLNGQRRSLASRAFREDLDNEREKGCSLSPEVLAKIKKNGTSEWLVDDRTVKLLRSNLNKLIRCTEPFDKVLFSTRRVIRLNQAIEIPHRLQLSRVQQTSFGTKKSDASTTVFTCPPSGPVFSVSTSSFFTAGITIADCEESASSGTIIVQPHSVATLKNIRIKDNKIRGIYIMENANVTLSDAYFAKNKVVGSGPAIYMKSNSYVTITDSTFLGNIAENNNGGAIYLGHLNNIVINGSKIIGNVAAHFGGALFLYAENILTIVGSKLTDNGAENGGGIYLMQNNTASMQDVVVSENIASVREAMYAYKRNAVTSIDSPLSNADVDYNGGGIRLHEYNKLFVRGCVFSDNHAARDGGAIKLDFDNKVTIQRCKMQYNDARNGGALYNEKRNTLAITDCVFSSNIARKEGGGIDLYSNNTIVMQKCQLLDNLASNGGALYGYNYNKLTIVDSILTNNLALHNGGAIGLYQNHSVSMQECALLNNHAGSMGGSIDLNDYNNVTMRECVLSNNYATSVGGAINLDDYNDVSMRECELKNNKASSGGAMHIHNKNALNTIDCVFSNNSAVDYGGGIRLCAYNDAFMRGCVLSDNNARYSSGGMDVSFQNSVTMRKCELKYNKASSGGAIYLYDRNGLTTIDCDFTGNIARYDGGGINLYMNNTIIMPKCRLLDNTASRGGALYAYRNNLATIIDSILTDNRGAYNTKYGRGLYMAYTRYYYGYNNSLIVKNTQISRNNAQGAETSYPSFAVDATSKAALVVHVEEDAKYAKRVSY